MTRPDLDAIQARCDAATPGPWIVGDDHDDAIVIAGVVAGAGEVILAEVDPYGVCKECNVTFAAHARTDVPALLAYVRELEEELRKKVEDYDTLFRKYRRSLEALGLA